MLAFPCNQFGFQSPGSSEDERLYTLRKFGLETLPVFDKVEVNGRGACDVYRFLKQQQPNAAPLSSVQRGGNANISWNFEKFLVGRDGVPLARYKPSLDPRAFEADLRLALAGKPARPAECLSHPGRIVCTQPMKVRFGTRQLMRACACSCARMRRVRPPATTDWRRCIAAERECRRSIPTGNLMPSNHDYVRRRP